MKERMVVLLREMNKGIYEKESEIALALLAALAGESIILLGPPGVAKSMIARRLKLAFKDAHSFEYLMSRFSTPDEIFGPVSISRLKSSDRYERSIEGYLPTADVVFLDEIWKAGPAIQNTLLTVINEKLFRNGNTEIRLPLKLLVAASNELPTQGEGLEALWDRFIIRLESKSIRKESNFNRMLLDVADIYEEQNVNSDISAVDGSIVDLQISNAEYVEWRKLIAATVIPENVLHCISLIRRSLTSVLVDDADERRRVYVSDRRWKNIVRLLRTAAFMQDCEQVQLRDLLPVYHCLWQEPDERDSIRDIVIRSIFSSMATRLAELKSALEDDIKNSRYRRAAGQVTRRQQQRDADKKTYNDFYYHLSNHDTGHSFVVMTDYQQLPGVDQEPMNGILYHDHRNPNVTIIRSYDAGERMPIGSRPVALTRDESQIYIDGVEFEIEKLQTAESQESLFSETGHEDSHRDYAAEIEKLADDLRNQQHDIEESLFVAEEDKEVVRQYLNDFFKEIAFTRQDMQKLYE